MPQFSIASSAGGLTTPFPVEPKIEPVLPDRVVVALSNRPKFAGYEGRILRWDWLTEADWASLKALSGGAALSAVAYIRCKMLDPLAVVSSARWADYSCHLVTPAAAGQVENKLRLSVTCEVRTMQFIQDVT